MHEAGEGAWTWRDDGADTPPDETTLLHGRTTGNGWIQLRRGARWADSPVVGELRLTWDDGLRLMSLDFAGFSVGQQRALAPAVVEDGAVVSDNNWRCEVSVDAPYDTYYAVFDRNLVSVCDGDNLPGGTWVFGEGMGLVALESGGVILDLVAPW